MHYCMTEEIMKTILRIEGMSCDHCVQHVKEALEAVMGVTSADVSLPGKSAEVTHGDSVKPEDLRAAVVDAGYEAA